jgi:hypothetical protein
MLTTVSDINIVELVVLWLHVSSDIIAALNLLMYIANCMKTCLLYVHFLYFGSLRYKQGAPKPLTKETNVIISVDKQKQKNNKNTCIKMLVL